MKLLGARNNDIMPVHTGTIRKTSALLAEGDAEINDWHDRGNAAFELETATRFAVARSYGIDRISESAGFDNPYQGAYPQMEVSDTNDTHVRGKATVLDPVVGLADSRD